MAVHERRLRAAFVCPGPAIPDRRVGTSRRPVRTGEASARGPIRAVDHRVRRRPHPVEQGAARPQAAHAQRRSRTAAPPVVPQRTCTDAGLRRGCFGESARCAARTPGGWRRRRAGRGSTGEAVPSVWAAPWRRGRARTRLDPRCSAHPRAAWTRSAERWLEPCPVSCRCVVVRRARRSHARVWRTPMHSAPRRPLRPPRHACRAGRGWRAQSAGVQCRMRRV